MWRRVRRALANELSRGLRDFTRKAAPFTKQETLLKPTFSGVHHPCSFQETLFHRSFSLRSQITTRQPDSLLAQATRR